MVMPIWNIKHNQRLIHQYVQVVYNEADKSRKQIQLAVNKFVTYLSNILTSAVNTSKLSTNAEIRQLKQFCETTLEPDISVITI